MNQKYNALLKEKIAELQASTEDCKEFYATDISYATPIVPIDMKAMAFAFVRTHVHEARGELAKTAAMIF